MNPKALYIVFATVLIVGSACITIVTIEASEQGEFREATGTDIPVLILSDEASDISEKISFGTSDIRISTELTDADAKAVIIDDDWAKSQKTSEMDDYVKSLLDSGIIVTVLDSPDLFIRNPELNFKAFMEDCDTYSAFKASDDSSFKCSSIDDGGTGKAMAKTYCWIYEQVKKGGYLQ